MCETPVCKAIALSSAAIVTARLIELRAPLDNRSIRRPTALLSTSAAQERLEKTSFPHLTGARYNFGHSGSGLIEHSGYQKLVAAVCSGFAGAVFCIEASRLVRKRRDWRHLTDLCALADMRVIDPDGAYNLCLANDRLILGLKRTMSEYALNLLRQQGIAASALKAQRGESRFVLPLGFCRDEIRQIEMNAEERVSSVIPMPSRQRKH